MSKYLCTNCWTMFGFEIKKCSKCWSFAIEEQIEEKSKKDQVKEAQKAFKEKGIAEWIDLSQKKNKEKNLEKEKKVEGHYVLAEKEINRVFWKWVKKGAIYLLAWQPGIWKSTILQQILNSLLENPENKKNTNIAYFSGEENENQVEERTQRLKVHSFDTYATTCLEDIFTTIKSQDYNFVVIDSISTLASNAIPWLAGSVSQIKYCSGAIKDFMKEEGVTCFLIWHVTKDMDIAWPMYLEHIVDAVFTLDGDRYWLYRYLRATKNRFWPSDEVGIFEMQETGLKAVDNYHELIMKEYIQEPWCALWIALDNWRPLLVNIQILRVATTFNFPLRQSVWYPKERLIQILAILSDSCGCDFSKTDIHLQIPGDIKFTDTALDLPIAMALLSAYFQRPLDKVIFMWELTLKWLVRQPSFYSRRKKEAWKNKIIDYTVWNNIKEIYQKVFSNYKN